MNKNFRNLLATLLLGVFTLFNFVACGGENKPITEGYLWQATKGDITINLIGTMHPAPSTHDFFNKKVDKIMKNTDVLSVEADITDTTAITASQDKLLVQNGDNLTKHLSQDEISKLNTILEKSNLNSSGVSVLTPAGVSSILESTLYSEEKFDGKTFDELLILKAKEKNIEVDELEGIDFQMDLLNNLYTWDSVKETIDTLSDKDKKSELAKYLKDTFNAYTNGDIEFLENDVKTMKSEEPEFYDALITKRNVGMAEKINTMASDGKRHTIAVGCKHFIGEDSVLKELEKMGYTISRL